MYKNNNIKLMYVCMYVTYVCGGHFYTNLQYIPCHTVSPVESSCQTAAYPAVTTQTERDET